MEQKYETVVNFSLERYLCHNEFVQFSMIFIAKYFKV